MEALQTKTDKEERLILAALAITNDWTDFGNLREVHSSREKWDEFHSACEDVEKERLYVGSHPTARAEPEAQE